jgi:HAD superfamily hydrolase (TIGR01509 family)
MSGLKAIIFDMDGVLIDSVAIQVQAFAHFLAPFGVPFGMDRLAQFNGVTTREILQTVKTEANLPYDIESAIAERNRIAREMLDQATPFPRAREVVNAFRLRGYRVALASSASRALIEKLCAEWEFDAVVSGDEIAASKSEPDIYLRAAESLGVGPRECAVVEDSPLGLASARSVGMYTVAVDANDQHLMPADFHVRDVRELLSHSPLFARELLRSVDRPIPVEEIALVHEPGCPDLPDEIVREIDRQWSERPASPSLFNGRVANLIHARSDSRGVVLEVNTTDYKTYHGLRSRDDYDIFAHGICALGTSGLIVTKDRQVIVARRGTGLVGDGQLYNGLGGLVDPEATATVEQALLAELEEEFGIPRAAVSTCTLVGFGHDLVSKGVELLCSVFVDVEAADVISLHRGARDAAESSGLKAVPVSELPAVIPDLMPASRTLVECHLSHYGDRSRNEEPTRWRTKINQNAGAHRPRMDEKLS